MKNMKNQPIVIKRKELVVFPALEGYQYGKGKYLVVTKCQAGFPTTSYVDADSPIAAFRRYKAKAIMNISKVGDNHNSTVFARVGKKVWIAEEMLVEMTVGDINQDLSNTGLYHQGQYQLVGAKTWADKAYIANAA
jgi:hypothetical protein